MASKDQNRRSKRGIGVDENEDELSIKIPKLEDLDDEEKRSHASSVSPAVGKLGQRRETRASQDKPAELFRKDLISAMKLADTEQLQVDNYVTISDPWRQEWEKGVQVPVNPDGTINRQVIIRKIDGNENLHGTYAFKFPKKYLHAVNDDNFKQGIHELHETQKLAEQMCRYDLDDLDVSWLNKFNEEREAMGHEPVFEWVMEKVIEEVETQCYNNMQNMIKTVEGLGIEYDENVVCDVCRSPEGEDNNEIVFCDGCDICVHQACYGVQKIPEGSWLCRTCALGIQPKCILCPNTGGAMKSTKSGTKWAHVSCALWIPEVSIGCPEKMEPVTKISHIPSSRWSLICAICRERNGSCIQCSVKTCKTAFHVTCAFNNNLNMKTFLDEDHDDVQLKAYCSKHSRKKDGDSTPRKEPSTPKREHNILLRDPSTPTLKKESEMTEEEKTELRSERLAKLAEEFYCCVQVPEVAEACNMNEETIDFFVNYWVLKRKANFNKPLLMPKTEEADLLVRQREDSLVARMKMFIHLRQDLERVRNLCYMLGRREKIRRQLYNMKEEIFHHQVELLSKLGSRSETREFSVVSDAHKEPYSIYDQYDGILSAARLSDQRVEQQQDEQDSEIENTKSSKDTKGTTKRSGNARDSKRRLAFEVAARGNRSGRGKVKTENTTEDSPVIVQVSKHNKELNADIKHSPKEMNDDDFVAPKRKSRHSDGSKNSTSKRAKQTLGKGSPATNTVVCKDKEKRKSSSKGGTGSATKDKNNRLSSAKGNSTVGKDKESSGTESDKTKTVPVRRSARQSGVMDVNDNKNDLQSENSEDNKQGDSSVIQNESVKDDSSVVSNCSSKHEKDLEIKEKGKQDCVNSTLITESYNPKKSTTGIKPDPETDLSKSECELPQENYLQCSSHKDKKHTKSESSTSKNSDKTDSGNDPLKHEDTLQSKKLGKSLSDNVSKDTGSGDVGAISPVLDRLSKEIGKGDHCTKSTNTDKDKESCDNIPVIDSKRRSSKDALKLGGNGTPLPPVEVSVDEKSGRISLKMHTQPVVSPEKSVPVETNSSKSVPDETNGSKSVPVEINSSKSVPDETNGSKSVPDETNSSKSMSRKSSLDNQITKSVSKPARRTSCRLQNLGINGLVSPSQLVVNQDIKDKVHRRLSCHRHKLLDQKQIQNGILDGSPKKLDQYLASRRSSSESFGQDMLDVTGLVFTKENNPRASPILSRFHPMHIDLTSPDKSKCKIKTVPLGSPVKDSNGGRWTPITNSGRSTPERHSTRTRVVSAGDLYNDLSSRDSTPERESANVSVKSVKKGLDFGRRALEKNHRKKIGSGRSNCSSSIVISDSEDHIAESDSDYAPSESSSSSECKRLTRNKSGSKITLLDEASRDSTSSSVLSSSRLSRSFGKFNSLHS